MNTHHENGVFVMAPAAPKGKLTVTMTCQSTIYHSEEAVPAMTIASIGV